MLWVNELQEVVAEELAAAGLAGIQLADPTTCAPAPPVAATATSAPSGAAAPAAGGGLSLAPPSTSTAAAAGGGVVQQEVELWPGVSFACTDPDAAAAAGAAQPRPGRDVGRAAAAAREVRLARLLVACGGAGAPGAALAAALAGAQVGRRSGGALLLRLGRHGGWGPGAGHASAWALLEGRDVAGSNAQVLQLGAGPGALCAMVAVRRCGARRALATHPWRDRVVDAARRVRLPSPCPTPRFAICAAGLRSNGTALRVRVHARCVSWRRCVHANAARLVVERVRLAQLRLGEELSVRHVLSRCAASQRLFC